MNKILCSTGALLGKSNNRDYRLLKELSEQLTCDGYEFMMYSSWYAETDELIETLLSLKTDIPVMHCEKKIGETVSKGEFEEANRRFEKNCYIAQAIGAKSMVVHLWDGVTSDAHFENNIEAYGHLRDIADGYGIKILVENVVCNRENPMKHWCELREKYPDIQFVFDTKMASFHSQMDLLYDESYRWLWQQEHIRHYHVNDYSGGYMEWEKLRTLPIGRGNVDFERFFGFIREIGYTGTFTAEATAFDREGNIDTDMLNEQFSIMRKYLCCGEGTLSARLFALQDLKYREFHAGLIPGVPVESIIGVRTPEIRKLAKKISGTDEAKKFMQVLPHKYYEENNLHGCLIEGIKEYDCCVAELNRFLPYVDNWATCDLIRPKAFQKNTALLLADIKRWLSSDHAYTVRFGIEMLMKFFLDKEYRTEYSDMVAEVQSTEYYVNMMIAWYFATALAKQYDSVLPYLKERRLDVWTHNKTIQKAVESYRITDAQKAELRVLKIKQNG